MSDTIGWAEASGVQEKPGLWDRITGKEAAPAPKVAGPTISWQEAQGQQPSESTFDYVKEIGKKGISLGAATGDLLLGVPGMVAGHLLNIGTRLYGNVTGEDRKITEQAGELAEQLPTLKIPGTTVEIPLEGLKTPLQTIAKTVAGIEPWNQDIVMEAMEHIASGVEKATKGIVSAADTKLAFGIAMDAAGAKGLQMTAKAITKPAAPPTGAEARMSYIDESPPAEVAPKMPEVMEITTPKQVKAIFAEAKKAGLADPGVSQVMKIFEDAKKPQAKAAEPFPPAGVAKTKIAEGLPLDEAKVGEALRKLREEPFNMTAAEKVLARGAVRVSKSGNLVDPQGRPIFSKGQKGGAQDLDTFMASMAALSVGTAAALAVYKYLWKHQAPAVDEEQEQGRAIREKTFIDELKQKDKGLHLPGDVPGLHQKEPPKLWVSLDDVTAGLVGGAMLAGAVKGVGEGVWTRGAVKRLAEPLSDAAARGVGNAAAEAAPPGTQLDVMAKAQEPIVNWSERAITKHLNKHFGAETDPLNDVKIPMLGDEVTWGQVADKVVKSAKIPERLKMLKEGKAQQGEAIWDVEPDIHRSPAVQRAYENYPDIRGSHLNALTSYLSHVGDYLREFVPAEKLQQYDLVRAVRETAAQDVKQAAKMAKARASGEGTTPYKTYPDGMKWVEVKSAEALKNEGDVMGHCVGGYCEAVHNGESKIFSLRDSKGMSHVTVEVAPRTETAWRGSALAGEFWDKAGKEYQARHPQVGGDEVWSKKIFASPEYKAWIAQEPAEILQIKGKQNRAPVAAYLPYVQDFVKSGKWGDVGDLQNTGLIDVPTRGIKGAPERYMTPDALNAWQVEQGPGLPKGQRGSVDPKLLTSLAAVGGGAAAGAWLDNTQPLKGSIYGALAGLALGTPGGRNVLKATLKSPDAAIGLISTRLGNIAPELKLAIRRHEKNVLQTIDRTNDQILPFIQALAKLPKDATEAVSRALLNGDTATINAIPELRASYPGVTKALGMIKGELQALGRFGEGVVDYFPRIVKDLEGLKKHLGTIYSEGIEKALLKAEASMIRKEGRSLTDVEQSLVVNRFLFAADKTAFQPGYAKGRRIEEITPDLMKFYEPPTESLLRYISGSINDIQTAKFFGRDLAKRKQGGKTYSDIDTSIGNLTARLQLEGKLTREQGVMLRDILKARFEGGDKGMSTVLANTRNLTNTALLGNIASAATQIGDSLLTVYHHGTIPTIQAVAQRLMGKQVLTAKKLGLINHVAEELSGRGATGAALQNTMKYSGFLAIDMFAKGINLNAGLIKNTKLAQTAAGQKLLWDRYGRAFGDDMPKLIEDLKARRLSDDVETLAFSELSDAQPISKAEMPEIYLRHPNGRILYQLKTYMLKQVDVVRRDAYQKIASGEPKQILEGAKNLAALGAIYALANVPGDVVKDILAGRDIDPFTTPKLVENVLQTFGLNRYAQERVSKGKVVETTQDMLTPPVRVFQDIAKTADSVLKGESDYKGFSYIPLGGRVFYERYLGGNERREISEKRSENAGKPKGERKKLSPEAKAYLRQKREERALRKLEEGR